MLVSSLAISSDGYLFSVENDDDDYLSTTYKYGDN